jgi:hypothetical protein
MDWQPFGSNLFVHGEPCDVRSVRLADETGNLHRFRVSTCWNPGAAKFTKTPAYARLVKDSDGRIGAVVVGHNGGFLKIGKFPACLPYIFVPLSSICKKAQKRLLKGKNLDFFSDGNFVFAREK